MHFSILFFVTILIIHFSDIVVADQMTDMIRKEGVSIELHHVTTEDGYILNLYRLKKTNRVVNKKTKVMLIIPPMLSSSALFVLYPNASAGYYFLEKGYDLWIGNNRGTTFARNHTYLDPNDDEFWKFSWHEMGIFDLPAIIDYILLHTQKHQLTYIGHSQSSTIIFVLLAERPNYNRKISSIHTMAPQVIPKYYHPLIAPIVPYLDDITYLVEKIGIYELVPYRSSAFTLKWAGAVCSLPIVTEMCRLWSGVFPGISSPNNYYPGYTADLARSLHPAGVCAYQLIHYAQCFAAGRFQHFDYGHDKNLQMYNASSPPKYDLLNIRTKVHLMYGENDLLVLQKNIPLLVDEIKNAKLIRTDKMELFNHNDFIFGRQIQNLQTIIWRTMKAFDRNDKSFFNSNRNKQN